MNISKNSILKSRFQNRVFKICIYHFKFLKCYSIFVLVWGRRTYRLCFLYLTFNNFECYFRSGLNILNCDMQLKKNIFYSYDKQYSLKFISFLLLLITTLFVLFDDSYLILIACLIQVLPGTYIMRFLSVKRRSQEILSSVVYGELLPALLKFFIIISFSFLQVLN